MAKTKAEITGLDKIKLDVKTFVTAAIKDREVLDAIALESATQIKNRTRARLEEYKQPDIKKSTKERRESLIKSGNGSEFSKPNRSNLTLSGQLLDSIAFRVNEAKSTITLYFKENRKPYKGKKGQDLEKKSNKEIMLDLDSRGFKFFFISDRLNALLQSKIKTILRQRLSNYRKLKRSLK